MKRRLLWLLLVILLAIGVTFGEYKYLLSTVDNDPLVEIYVLNKDLKRGDQIGQDDLTTKSIRVAEIESDYIQTSEKIVGDYVSIALKKGSIVLRSVLKTSGNLKLTTAPDNMLVTFAFDGETSNAWNIRIGQEVELFYCAKGDEEDTKYQQVVVAGIYDDEVLPIQETGISAKRYVTFEMSKNRGYDLIAKRYDGRIEIIIL